jgi:hypothetical protein
MPALTIASTELRRLTALLMGVLLARRKAMRLEGNLA